MGPCLCLAFINLVPLIRACSGLEVLSKPCDQQYTGVLRGSGSSNLVPAGQDTTDTVKLKYNSSIPFRD